MGEIRPTATEQRIAEAMCMADRLTPYEQVSIDKSESGAKITYHGQRWELYLGEARRFIAAMQAISFND